MTIPFSHALVMSKFSTIMSPAGYYSQSYNSSDSFVKVSNPFRGGNALLNRMRSAMGNVGSSGVPMISPRRRSSRALLPLAALGAAGVGAAGLYGSGYGNELMGQASQMGNDLYGQATQYGDQIRNADYGNEVNELLFRTGIRDRGTLGNIGQSADDFLDRNGIQLPRGLPPISTMGSAAETEIGRFADRLPRIQF